MTAYAGVELPLRAGAGAGRGGALAAAVWEGGRAGGGAARRGSQPDGEVVRASAADCPVVDERTTEAGGGSRAGRPRKLAGQAQRRRP